MHLDPDGLLVAREVKASVLPGRRAEGGARPVREAVGLGRAHEPEVQLPIVVRVLEDLDRVIAGGEVREDEIGAAVLWLDLAEAKRPVAAVEVRLRRAEREQRVSVAVPVALGRDPERSLDGLGAGRRKRCCEDEDEPERGLQRTASATTRSASTWFVASFRVPTSFASFQRARRSRMRSFGPSSETSSASASGTAAMASTFLPSR